MIGHRYRDIRTVLVESDASLRRGLRSVLVENGMREVVHGQGVRVMLDAIEQEMFDLILCDVSLLGPEFAKVMQEIRQNRIGRNPFVVIVATALEPTESRVMGTLNGGVDDLLSKPASITQLLDRVGHLVHGRKPFVATDTYVGPTRRRFVRPGENDHDLVHVPNTMRDKMVEHLPELELQRRISEGVIRVAEKKLQSPLTGLDSLISSSLERFETGGDSERLRRDFDHLLDWGRELEQRKREAGWGSVAALIEALVELVERITQSPSRPRRADLEALSKLGVMIRRKVAIEQFASLPPRPAAPSTPSGVQVPRGFGDMAARGRARQTESFGAH